MKIAEVMDSFKTANDLRDYATNIIANAMRDWIDSSEFPDRKRQAQVLRGRILEIVATASEKATELEQLCIGGDVDLQLLLRAVARTGRAHLGSELTALQGVLDLLDRIDSMPVENGVDAARANSWLSLAEQLVNNSREAIAFHLPQQSVDSTLEAIRATLRPTAPTT
jgi:hypothetical protein